MNIIEIISSLIPALVGGGILGAFLEKRKRKAETETIEADVLSKLQAQYKIFLDDYEKKYKSIVAENQNTQKKMKYLKDENTRLRERVEELEGIVKKLKDFKHVQLK